PGQVDIQQHQIEILLMNELYSHMCVISADARIAFPLQMRGNRARKLAVVFYYQDSFHGYTQICKSLPNPPNRPIRRTGNFRKFTLQNPLYGKPRFSEKVYGPRYSPGSTRSGAKTRQSVWKRRRQRRKHCWRRVESG